MIEKVNACMFDWLIKEKIPNDNSYDVTKIKYTFMVIVSETEKILLLFLLFFILGFKSDFLFSMIVYIPIKHLWVGLHCRNWERCFLTTASIIWGIILLSSKFAVIGRLFMVVSGFMIASAILLIPGYSKTHVLSGKREVIKIKIYGVVLVVIMCFLVEALDLIPKSIITWIYIETLLESGLAWCLYNKNNL